ncbi:MAG TPA: aminoacyl-tRNA hydrolase [Polyangiaceae bacterium]|nr:aminoacyl-tRNA hydrolase [Polyangiaceae bacterium]
MLVVGLGNPGARYSGTPHNVGFCVLDRLAEHLSGGASSASASSSLAAASSAAPEWADRFDAQLLMARLDSEELVLLKPLTFMNRSGRSVRQAMTFFEIPVQSTLVVHDELDLPFGSVKLKRGGGEAGHRGLESVSEEVGSRDYLRVRVGVGKPASGDVADFLLEPFGAAQQAELGGALDAACDAALAVARHGIDRAMNQVNRQAVSAVLPAKADGPETGRPD